MSTPFRPFGISHWCVLALTIIAPLLLAFASRRHSATRLPVVIRICFAVFLIASWVAWYLLFSSRGWLTAGNILPMNLCDWAMIATLVTLIHPNQASYNLAYFWSLAGATQALLTPDVTFDFPDPQFLVFFAGHMTVVAAVIYLTLGLRLRPRLSDLPRVILWSLVYLAAAGVTDWLLGVNYGFLRAKPHHASLYDLLWPWPYYILQTVMLGIASMAVLYAPFLARDRLCRRNGPSGRPCTD